MNPRALLSSFQAHPLALDLFLLDVLGPEYYGWEPEVVFFEAAQEAKASNIHAVNKLKIRAILAVHDAGAALEQHSVFSNTVLVFNDVQAEPSVLQKPDLGQLLSGTDIIWKLRSGELSEEVLGFIAACLLDAGIVYAPPPLDAANALLREYVPRSLHDAVGKHLLDPVSEDVGPEEGALRVQLAKIREARVYSASQSSRLVDQLKAMKVSNELGNAQGLH